MKGVANGTPSSGGTEMWWWGPITVPTVVLLGDWECQSMCGWLEV